MAERGTYIHGHADAVLRSHRWRTAANSAAYLLPHLRPGLTLLDVGCGPGTITADLARLVSPGGAVVGVDAAVAAVEAARAERPEGAAVAYAVADATRLPHRDASFDVVYAHQVLQHLADPVSALAEMGRVCRPEGVVAARDADYAAMAWYPPDERLDRWLTLYQAVARANGGEPDAGRRLRAWARAAGLVDIQCSASAWGFTQPEDRAWWGETWAQRVTASTLADQARGLGLATTGELAELAAGWRRWAADDDGWFAVVHAEVLARRP